MKLTNKGRYAVMAMADLALNSKNGPISLTEISIRQNISLAVFNKQTIVGVARGPFGQKSFWIWPGII